MGWRFQRRIPICKGLRLNASSSGLSLSIGTRGAWFTVGPRGTRTTVGLPGTGISYTETSGGSRRRSGLVPPAALINGFTDGQWVCLGWLLAVALLVWHNG